MPQNLSIICVRLTPQTIHRLKLLAEDSAADLDAPNLAIRMRPYNRSELIRHVINTGLDLLQGEPPLELQGDPPCPTGSRPRQKTKAAQASDSSAPRLRTHSWPSSSRTH